MKNEEFATALVVRRVLIVCCLLFSAVANSSIFQFFNPSILQFFNSSILHAQGLPLIRNYTAEEYGRHNCNFDIEIGKDGTVYVANFAGLLYYDRAQWRTLYIPGINRVTVVYRASDDRVWVGSYNFLGRLEKTPNGCLTIRQVGRTGQFKGEVVAIFETEGRLQFVAGDNCIYEIGPDDQLTLKQKAGTDFRVGMESKIISVEALLRGDRQVVLEDITQTEELDGGLLVKVKRDHGLLITDKEGHTLYTITEENGLCSDQVAYVAYDGHGVLWGATANGIFAIGLPSPYTYLLSKDGLTGEVRAITSFDGKIYVGSTNGLYTVVSRQAKRVAGINNRCWALCEDRQGLLAATSSGIFRIAHGGAISRLTSNATTALMVDGNRIYAGETDGVYLYQSGTVSKVDDLPLVTEIRKDAGGRLWMKNVHGETKGVAPAQTIEPAGSLPKHLLWPLGDMEIKAQYRDGDRTWLGGVDKLVVVDTSQKDLDTLTASRHVRFRSIVMGTDSVLWGGFGEMPRSLPRLRSDERRLRFIYAVDYTPLTGKTMYRYRIRSALPFFSEKNAGRWSDWSESQVVEFLNHPYGKYTLSVQARLANGELTEVASVGFSIAYPLLMRWYMIIVYFLLMALLVYAIMRYRLKKLQHDKIKLEQIVEERTADLRDAQQELIRQEKMASVGQLTEGLIDRILNPMNYVINFSKMSIDLLKDLKVNIENNKEAINEDDYADTEDVLDMLTVNLQNVDQYGQNTSRTLKAMEEMLEDRTGGYVDMDLLPVLQQNEQMVNTYYAKEKEQYNIQTVFTLPSESMPIYGNPDMLSRTIMGLLGNAVYAVVKKAQKNQEGWSLDNQGDRSLDSGKNHGPVPLIVPQILFSALKAEGRYILKIRDNGIGIEATIIDKIFDPFFTTKTTDEAAGIGLYLSREIIQNHGGDISVESVKDEYTEFTITLPVKI